MGGENKAGTGLSTLDLMGSSPAVNRVVRIMLKRPRMSEQELLDSVAQLPAEKRISPDDLREALDSLIKMEWLEKINEGGQTIYSVVLKPKASSSEQLHSSDLPPLEVAGDKKMDPKLNAPDVLNKRAEPKKSGGLMGALKNLLGGKK